MFEKINKVPKVEKIQKITIPDSDMNGWIKTLREGDFTEEEINSILIHLNATYAGIKKEQYVNEELNKMEREVAGRRGRGFTEEKKEAIRQGIESRFNVK